ncbi:MAG: hypothetical protein R3A48_28655 [Polyangiales bacterium]
MSADEHRQLIAERAMAEDIVTQHGYVGALRLALRIVERTLRPMSPADAREAWRRAVESPLADLVLMLERLEAAGAVDRPRRRTRAQA